MNFENIEYLLDKYEQGKCSAEESLLVESFLQEAEADSLPLYDAFVEKEREIFSTINPEQVISEMNSTEDTDLLAERIESGQASKEQIQVFEDLLAKAENSKDPLYKRFVEMEQSVASSLDIEQFVRDLEKDEVENIDTLLEQSEEDLPKAYTSFISVEKQRRSSVDVASLIDGLGKQQEAKVIGISSKKRWRSLAGIAAVLVVIMSAMFLLPKQDSFDGGYATVNGEQIDDPELAMEYALAILGKTSKKLEQGTGEMKHLKDLKHTQIFK